MTLRTPQYLEACRGIPASSPVAGATAWRAINARRADLVSKSRRTPTEREELRRLRDVAIERATPIVGRTLANRLL